MTNVYSDIADQFTSLNDGLKTSLSGGFGPSPSRTPFLDEQRKRLGVGQQQPKPPTSDFGDLDVTPGEHKAKNGETYLVTKNPDGSPYIHWLTPATVPPAVPTPRPIAPPSRATGRDYDSTDRNRKIEAWNAMPPTTVTALLSGPLGQEVGQLGTGALKGLQASAPVQAATFGRLPMPTPPQNANEGMGQMLAGFVAPPKTDVPMDPNDPMTVLAMAGMAGPVRVGGMPVRQLGEVAAPKLAAGARAAGNVAREAATSEAGFAKVPKGKVKAAPSDALTPDIEARIRGLDAEQRANMIKAVEASKDLSPEAKARRLALLKENAPSPAAAPLPGQAPLAAGKQPTASAVPAAAQPPAQPPTPPQGTAAGAGSQPPKPPSGNLARVQTMLQQQPNAPRDWGDMALKAQEYLNDTFYGVRRLQSDVGKNVPIAPGSKLDVTTRITTAPGAAQAGLGRYELAVAEMKRLAPNANVTNIDTVIFAEHGKEVLAAKGPKRVLPGGVNTVAGLDDALRELEAKLGPDEYSRVRSAAEVVKRTYAAERDRLVASGLIDKKVGAALAKEYPWYNPLRYMDNMEEAARVGRSTKPLTVTSSGLQRLSEVGSEAAIQNPMTTLAQQLVRNEIRIQKNELAKGIVALAREDPTLGVVKRKLTVPVAQREGEVIFGQRHGEIPGTLSFFESGKRQVYDVPEWLYREAVTLQETVQNPAVSMIGALNGISRAAFTTVSPAFVVSNMANDMLPAMVRGGVLPTDTARRLALSFKSLENDPLAQVYRLSGALQSRFYGKDAAEIAKLAGASGGKVIGKNFNLKRAALDFIPELGQKGEQAPRMAVFEKELNRTLPNWRNMPAEQAAATQEARVAAAKAVEATINFGRGGYLIRSANPLVIFLNANMEGIKLPFRTLGVLQPGQNSARARWTLAGLTAGMAGLTGYNLSYPEYLDVPDKVRWGSVVIMLPSNKTDLNGKPVPRYLSIIPNTREWAAFFGPVNYAMEKAFKDNPEDYLQFAKAMIPQVSPVSQLPLPEVASEAVEQATNYDLYSGTPIIPQGKQALPPTEQTGPYVSPTVERAAQVTGWSPLRVQHSLQGIFGGAGSAVTSVLDLVVGAQNKRGQELKAQYQAMAPNTRGPWLNSLKSADRSALNAAMASAERTVPILSSVTGRFYHERGGQLEANDWTRFNNTVNDTNGTFDKVVHPVGLDVRLGSVGDSVDLTPGRKGGSVQLTPRLRAEYQRIMAQVVTDGVKQVVPTLRASDGPDVNKAYLQGRIDKLKDTARTRFMSLYRAELYAQLNGKPAQQAAPASSQPQSSRPSATPTPTLSHPATFEDLGVPLY